jgi:hypothetical protein
MKFKIDYENPEHRSLFRDKDLLIIKIANYYDIKDIDGLPLNVTSKGAY